MSTLLLFLVVSTAAGIGCLCSWRFQAGHMMALREGAIQPSDLVPEDFNKFVTERFGETFPAGGRGWMSFIREHTSSEQEAFDLFFQLREEYDRAKEC